MSQGNTYLGFSIKVSNVTGLYTDFGTRQNVKKRIADILYLEKPPADAIKLAYVASKDITVDNTLFIADRSDSLYANSRQKYVQEFLGTIQPISMKNKNFLVTQIFKAIDTEQVPLYYKHVLPATVNIGSIKILDKNLIEVNPSKYLVDLRPEYNEIYGTPVEDSYTECHVYNSLETWFSLASGEYEIYYIQYMDNSSGSDIVTTTLLNNEPAYKQAELEDIWPITLDPMPWLRVYTLSPELSLRLPTGDKYSIKYIEDKRIKVEKPTALDKTTPWFPRIIEGKFNGGIGGVDPTNPNNMIGVIGSYSIPEFGNQAFNPIQPYKRVARTRCSKISSRLIKLPHKDVMCNNLYYSMDITIETNGNLLYALTDDSDKIGLALRDTNGVAVTDSNGDIIYWRGNDVLIGVDGSIGIVAVDIDINDSWDIFAAYTYKETYYELTSLNMNPFFDQSVRSQIRVIYLVPESTSNHNLGTQSASIFWLKVAPSGKIESTSQDGTGGNEDINNEVSLSTDDGYGVTGVIGMYYSWRANTLVSGEIIISPSGSLVVDSTEFFPRTGWLRAKDSDGKWRYMNFINKTTTTFILGTSVPSATIPDQSKVELVNFTDEFTTESSRNPSEEMASYGDFVPLNNYPSVFCQYFILANLTLNPPHGISGLTIIDIRENGGGLVDGKYEEAKLINPEVQWFSDYQYYNGQPYPGDATIVVKLPESIKEIFSESQIQDIVEKNMAFGIKPIIRYYGYTANIVMDTLTSEYPLFFFVAPGRSTFTVYWEKEGSEFVYNLWLATSESGPWTKINTTRVYDSNLLYYPIADYNTYIISDLEQNTKYCVKITMLDKYNMWWYGYNGYGSIEGGYGLTGDTPEPPFGNTTGFRIRVE